MSVAIGTPHADEPDPPAFTTTKITAGATTPPAAAATGRAIERGSRSSPTTTSRLISIPTTKKKTAISRSLTRWPRSMAMMWLPTRTAISVDHSDS